MKLPHSSNYAAKATDNAEHTSREKAADESQEEDVNLIYLDPELRSQDSESDSSTSQAIPFCNIGTEIKQCLDS